jgi:hypothetical protein
LVTDRPSSQSHHLQPPRSLYAGIMALATLLGVAIASGVALMMGAPAKVAGLAAMAMVAGSFATFIPALLRIDRQTWGLAVLGASMARTMLILAIVLVIDRSRDFGEAHKTLWIAAMCGMGAILVIESAAAIRILSAMDKSASRPTPTTPAKA